MKLGWLGNSCVVIEAEMRVIVDPNYVAEPVGSFDYVLVTHEHADHIDIEKLRNLDYKKLVAPEHTLKMYDLEGIAAKPGDKFDGIEVLESWCWKSEESVSYLYNGVLHAGDSAKFPDCKARVVLTACFPDYYDDYVSEMKRLKPELVIPVHFKPEKRKNAEGLCERLAGEGINCRILEIGEFIEL
ncbi:MAG: MBL fold metallo-hydrolase [Archaeoglobaceae archaeon]